VIYAATIKTDPNTAVTDMDHSVLKVTKGLVYKVEFNFPNGPSGLAGIAVFDGAFQCWPSTIGEFFHSDDETIAFDDMYLKESAPYQFDIFTYNLDDTYHHTIQVRIGLVSKEVFLARFLPTKGYDYMAELTRKLQLEQEKRIAEQQKKLEETPYEWLAKQMESIE